ncbi:hypothetical protein FHS82_004175 [Pseudochelatococcus lubricantis]|uniref:Uncharacterized protein n=1 Tax=Pseudochelatococcus lubricantis TaxID=1538102 RepID=A0ABX0V504_9HYPH|nr:hypothetical protein [Pseudochelatococcus lubricantis]NIJ60304.1 hypothetical protein [Pseudochelatococcus lubricantis]
MLFVHHTRDIPQKNGTPLSFAAAMAIGRFLDHVFGGVRVVDLTFPSAGFSGIMGDVLVGVAAPERFSAEVRDFFFRFRQKGGHFPILSLGPELEPVLREGASGRDKLTILYLDSSVDKELIRSFFGFGDIAVLVSADAETDVWPDGVLDERKSIDFLIAGTYHKKFRLILPEYNVGGFDVLVSRDDPVESVYLKKNIVKNTPNEVRVSIELPSVSEHVSLVFPASRFIHDGEYKSESDGGYAWLWSGPSSHLRIFIGRLDAWPDKLRLKLTVVNTNDPRNLDDARIMVDGCIMPFTLEKWSATSGRFVVEILEPSADFTVLSIGCRHMCNIDGGRQVGFCVDRLEVVP